MSLGDFRDNQVLGEWRTEALNMIHQCRNLDGLITNRTCEHAARSCGQAKNHSGDPPR